MSNRRFILSLTISFLVFLLFLPDGSFAEHVLIYDNSDAGSSYFIPGDGYFTEVLDYGTSSGGTITRFTFGYATTLSNPGTITIRFYRGTDWNTSPGTKLKTFNFSGLSGSGIRTKTYDIPPEDQFYLTSGDLGYSYEFADSYTGALLASGGTGTENAFWGYDDWEGVWYSVWFGGSPWAGFYMKLYTGTDVQDPNTCIIEGYKFDDTNSDGDWDGGEPGLADWEIYLDINNNGTYEITEPNSITDPNGFYQFLNVNADEGPYTVAEVMKPGWTQTMPGGDGTYLIDPDPNGVYKNINFGNSTSPVTKYGGGYGTSASPYQIWTADHMNQIGTYPGDWNSYFVLMDDIDLAGYTGGSFNIIGFSSTPFQGVFDGNGHTISNFTFDSPFSVFYLGLFVYVDNVNAEIKNLTMINPNVIDDSSNASGALVGVLKNGSVTNCRVIGGTVTGAFRTGGLIGWIYSGGSVTKSCVKDGTALNTWDYCGGLVGLNEGTISDCYSGFSATALNTRTGGVAGGNAGIITNCYAYGPIYIDGSYMGGIAVSEGGSVIASFWDIQATGFWFEGDFDLDSTEMVRKQNFIDAGWDFVGESANGTDEVWDIYEGLERPYLSWENLPEPVRYSGGSGTAGDPWQIATEADLDTIGEKYQDWDNCFVLTADIDMTGYDYKVIGDSGFGDLEFSGSFDGNGHTISNVSYIGSDQNYAGLFGYVRGVETEIKDLGLVNCSFINGSNGAGCIVGALSIGRITDCWVEGGYTSSSFRSGGLVGDVGADGIVSGCYAVDGLTETEHNYAGGLVGDNNGLIANCYSTYDVGGEVYLAGGFAGNNTGTIINCYSTGSLVSGSGLFGFVPPSTGDVIGCFFDTSTCNIPYDSKATGITTTDMMMQSTFLSAGWDMLGEFDNGGEDVWRLCEDGSDYPRLSHQFNVADIACGDGVDLSDFSILSAEWLLEDLTADVMPVGGDGIVNLADISVLAGTWRLSDGDTGFNDSCDLWPVDVGDGVIDVGDLNVFAGQWLMKSAHSADIAPAGGDGIVDIQDFLVFIDNWLSVN